MSEQKLKYAQKLMVVPYNSLYERPLKTYLSSLDEEMDFILNKKLLYKQFYTNILVKYKKMYDPEIMETGVDNSLKLNELSTKLNEIKKEIKEEHDDDKLKNDLKDFYENLNVKLEETNDKVESLISNKTNNKRKSKLNLSSIQPREILKAKRRIKNKLESNKHLKLSETQLENNTSLMETDDPLNTALNKTNPLITRSSAKTLRESREKAEIKDNLTGSGFKFKWLKTKFY